MRRLKLFCSVLVLSALSVGVTAVGVASAESTPLPDIHTALPGETYPIDLGGKTAVAGQIWENAGGGQLEWTETSVLLSALELTSLGLAIIVLVGLKSAIEPKHSCANEGGVEESGEVTLPNAEYHLVYTALSPSESLELAALILFTTFTILCGKFAEPFEIVVTGPSMMRVNPTTSTEGDATDLELASHCSATGVQALPYYYNDQLARVATTLLVNEAGAGAKRACEEIPGTILLTPETGSLATMFTVLF
jgi:hypothetical protein